MTTPHALGAVGPYLLLGILGRGGMGIVYEACHESTGARVALKTVLAPKERSLVGLRREIGALGRLRHPGIVRIIEIGAQAGAPWYAMEILEGRTLRAFHLGRGPALAEPRQEATRAASWWTESLPLGSPAPTGPPSADAVAFPAAEPIGSSLPRILSVLRRVCSALAYLHGEGLVHRDLKPENIIVRPDGTPVIVDFGLSLTWSGRESRERLAEAADVAGTVAYMAPEQVGGDAVDARADLYSLGCILYEVLTGRPPFFGASPEEVLAKHLSVAPRPPSEIEPQIPRPLDELVMKLIEKRPADRLGYADLVAVELAKLGAKGEDDVAGRPYLYRPDFWGREEILAQLMAEVTALKDGSGKVVLLGGESGAGKTRLAMTLLARAQTASVLVLTGECAAPSRPDSEREGVARVPLRPFQGVLRHIADRCRERGPEETERLLGRRRAVLAPYETSLGDIPGPECLPPEPLPSEAARARLFEDLAETLHALAGGRPLVLILDDLQWADGLTLGFLELLATGPALRRIPLLVLGIHRLEEPREGIGRMRRDPRVLDLALPRLDERALAQMGASMLATAISDEERGFLLYFARRAEGNPFFVAEYLRTAMAEGILARTADGHWHLEHDGSGRASYESLPLPGPLHDLIARRLVLLPPHARTIAQMASVLGRDVDVGILAAVCAWPEATLLEALADLVARQVLEDAGDGHFRFVHDKVRERGYDGIESNDKQDLHERSARAIEAAAGADPSSASRLGELGHHWERAGNNERAFDNYRRAAHRALGAYAHEEAEQLYRAAIELPMPPSEDRLVARIQLASKLLFGQIGGTDEAMRQLDQAAQEARAIGSRALEARALLLLGHCEIRLGYLDQARERADRAMRLLPEPEEPLQQARFLYTIANFRKSLYEYGAARELYEQCLAILEHHPKDELLLPVLLTFGDCLDDAHSHEDAHRVFDRALRVARRLGRRLEESYALQGLGWAHRDEGRLTEAHALCERALGIAREYCNRSDVYFVLSSMGEIQALLGRTAEARRTCEETLKFFRGSKDLVLEAEALHHLASIAFQEGDPADALRLYTEARAINRQLRDIRAEAKVLAETIDVHRAAGRPDLGRTAHAEAVDACRRLQDMAEAALANLHLACLEREAGDLDTADALLDAAQRVLVARHEVLLLIRLHCERGHLALARGRDARSHVDAAAALAQGLPPESPAAAQVRHLQERTSDRA